MDVLTGGRPKVLPYALPASAVFSSDGKHSIVALTHQLRVYFVSTRQCIRSVDIDLHDLVDMRIDGSLVLLFKSLGAIVTVNWKDRASQPIVLIHQTTIESLLSVVHVSASTFYVVSGKRDKKLGNSPHTRTIVKLSRETPEHQPSPVYEAKNVLRYAHSLDSSKIAFVTSDNEVLLVDLSAEYKNADDVEESAESLIDEEIISFPYKSKITAVAVSNDAIVALGTAAGPIQLLYGGLNADKPQGLLKWHIDQVRALQFTADNTYLLSGGLEKVLVFWQLETGKTQFLPRLNGAIEKISMDRNKSDYYNLLLNVTSSSTSTADTQDNYEVLTISAVDLISRLSVTSIKPKITNNVSTTLAKTKKKYLRQPELFDTTKLKYDYSSVFEVNPKSKHLYFPNEASIQAYDVVRNEQLFVQNSAPVLNTGKVRSEAKILDPSVSLLAFTTDGEWMCTFDTVSTSEIDNLLSKNDKQYALKFWKFIENQANGSTKNDISKKTGYWELSTKIIDPHGNSNPILSISAAPSSYHDGLAFLTSDSKGGLRIWRPRIPRDIYAAASNGNATGKQQQTAWTIRKSRPGFAQSSSDSVDACWSEDGSLIILAHECVLIPILTSTFEVVPPESFKLPSLSGSAIRSVSILGNNLIVLSKSRISSFNLLTGQLSELVATVNVTVGGKQNIAVNQLNKLVCLGVNYYDVIDNVSEQEDLLLIKSKLIVFHPDSLEPVYVHNYHTGISSVRSYNSSFIFVDLDARVGVLLPLIEKPFEEDEEEDSEDLTKAVKSMLLNAHATADVINNRNVSVRLRKINAGSEVPEIEVEVETASKLVDVHTFQPVFENLEGAQLENLFERIVKIIR